MSSLNRDEMTYVERFGRFWESFGGPRTAGRIIGWLMICEPPYQSASELVEVLGVSSGSVSTLSRQLMQLQMVERVTFPGDRASYYQLRDHVWVNTIENEMSGLRELAALAEAGRSLLPSERADRVEELAHVTDFFLAEWPDLVERLRTQMSNRVAARS